MTDCVANKGECCSGSVRSGTYGNAYDVAQITIDKCGRISRIKNVPVAGFVQPLANLVVSNSVTTTNIFASGDIFGNLSYLVNNSNYLRLLPNGSFTFPNNEIDVGSNSLTIKTQSGSGFTWDWNDGSGSLSEVNINSGGINFNVATPSLSSRWYFNTDGSSVFPNNIYASNSLTTGNVHVTDTLDVTGSMTANAANATFFFDTFTIPYINTQYLNVSSNTTLTGNLVVATANIATLNVGYLTVNSAVVYGATTLNVYGVSNLSTVTANTLSMSGDVFIGNVAITGAVQTTTGPMSRLTFDNTANTSVYPNKIVLYANTASSQYCGFGVTNLGPTGGASIAYGARQNHIFNTGSFLNTEIMRIGVLGTVGIGTASATAKLHVGTSLTQNVQVLVEASNVAIATTGGGRVGFGTSTPTSNLHVIGNAYVSNALTTTNVFVTTGATIGPTTLGTNVFVFSNVSGGSNVLIMNSLGRVGIATTSPSYPLDVGTTVNVPSGTGGETIRSKGPLIIANGVNDGNRFLSALDSSLTDGNARYFTIGKTNSLYNQAEISYVHIGDGLTTNRLNLGFMGVINTTFLANGNVGIGTSTPSSTLHAVGNIYASNAVTTTNVICTSVNSTYPLGFKNRIINGDFIIDQRNGGASSTPGAGATRVIDRWNVEIFGSGRCLVGQNLGAIASPTGFTSYYGMRVTTTTTPGVGDYFFIEQLIEGINTVDLAWGTASAKPATLSFWVYSTLTGTGGGFVRNAGESAGNYNRSYPFSYVINSTNTWEYKTVTMPGDTTGQWLSGQYDGVQIGFEMWNGSTYQGTAGAWAGANYTGPSNANINYAGTLNSNLYITGVQFEPGLVATPFERRHIGFELAQCQRYYEPSVARMGGYNTTGNYLRSSVYFNVKKRPKVSPTFTVISTPESNNLGSLNFDNSNFDQSSARIIAPVTATGDAYGQWKVAVDCEF